MKTFSLEQAILGATIKALIESKGNIQKAAFLLGIPRARLYRIIEKHSINLSGLRERGNARGNRELGSGHG